MAIDPKPTNTGDKLENPESQFKRPSEVANDKKLSHGEKQEALDTWEQDARQLITASGEGMTASDEGNTVGAVHLDDVVRAKEKIGEGPKNKGSH